MDNTQIKNPKHNASGGIDCEIDHPDHGWLPFSAHDQSGDETVQEVWDLVKDRDDIADFTPPENWKATAIAKVLKSRDDFLKLLTAPSETPTGMLTWSAKLASSLMIIMGASEVKGFLIDKGMPENVAGIIDKIELSMAALGQSRGMDAEGFALLIGEKFLKYAAVIFAADAKTEQAIYAINQLPNNVEGYRALDALEARFKAEAQQLAAAIKEATNA